MVSRLFTSSRSVLLNNGTRVRSVIRGCSVSICIGVSAKCSLGLRNPVAVDSIMLNRLNLVGLKLLCIVFFGVVGLLATKVDARIGFAISGRLVGCLFLIIGIKLLER